MNIPYEPPTRSGPIGSDLSSVLQSDRMRDRRAGPASGPFQREIRAHDYMKIQRIQMIKAKNVTPSINAAAMIIAVWIPPANSG